MNLLHAIHDLIKSQRYNRRLKKKDVYIVTVFPTVEDNDAQKMMDSQ